MTEAREFKREQRRVAFGMVGALAATILAFVVIAVLHRPMNPAPFAARLQAALRADLFVVGWLAAAIANVARLRFFSGQDIAAASEPSGTMAVQQARAILQNTFEQVVLAVLAHLALAATLRDPDTLIVTLICLFAAGRLLFWTGYRHGAAGRAFGFGLTFYPSIGALLLAATVVLLGWPG